MARTIGNLFLVPKKRIACCLLLLLVVVFTIIVLSTTSIYPISEDDYYDSSKSMLKKMMVDREDMLSRPQLDWANRRMSIKTLARLDREAQIEEMIASQEDHIGFLEAQYRNRQEEVINLQAKIIPDRGANISNPHDPGTSDATPAPFSPEFYALLKNITGTRAAAGIHTKYLPQLRTPFVYQLLPHLMSDPNSLKPAYHMTGGKSFSDVVIGIPTVKRDMETYLMITLSHLAIGMSAVEANSTLIIVMVGETDLNYVLNTARQIEIMFPKQVEQGMIEVLSPPATYYPNFENVPTTLGDSHKRVKWRTKQNLDTIYLMAYAQSKGTFYLMLEDDVIAKKNYMRDIKQFTAATTVVNPHWFFIEYCHVGGIGKLFRSSNLVHFITYVQLFYNNMPIDWLLESYLADKVCTIYKTSKLCTEEKMKIRPKYKSSLFQHIGLYSSLKGKIQKVKDAKYGTVPTYFPHTNPPLKYVKTDIEEHSDHTLKRAYEGQTYFWGVKPRKGDMVEFWFDQPTNIERYSFRSGNIEHLSDRFYFTTVEVLPESRSPTGNFTSVGYFDEFGLAEGEIKTGPILAIRLKVNRNSTYWVILSEIELKEAPRVADS